jgi:twinkle protein
LRDKDKNFTITGDAKKMGLFGLQLAKRNGKMIIITEGEIDAMSVSQAMGNTWACVSLPNGSASFKAVKDSLDFLETYEKVVICFDNDEPGHKATEAMLELLSPGKAYVVSLGEYKDANEMLLADPGSLRQAVWEAKEYRPDGVVNLEEMREQILAPLEAGTPYPWPKLTKMLYGFRKQELITWCAGTGVGKTALVSELVYDLLVNQKLRVGIIYLEEGVARSARRLLGIHCNKPLHLPEHEVTEEVMNEAWDATIGTGRLVAWDHFGSCADVDLLSNRVRYMRQSFGVDVVVLDHISLVVSGSDLDTDERRLLDKAMTGLRTLTQETGLAIHNVCHLNRRSGDVPHEEGARVTLANLRGTQAIAQLSDAVIAAERNQQATDLEERNTTTLRVLKNRYAGATGEVDKLTFDPETGRITPAKVKDIDYGEGDY